MATTTRITWSSATFHASSSISNGGNASDDIALDSDGEFFIDGQCDLDIPSGSPNGNVTIELFGSPDGTNYDTVPKQKIEVNFTATGNKKIPWTWTGFRCRCKVTNNTGVSVTYVGRRSGARQQTL